MTNACAILPGPANLARDVLASTDCFTTTRVEQAYGQLLAPGGGLSTALTLALTIYVAVYGYRLMLGNVALSLADVVPRFIKIGLMIAVVTSWPAYQRLVFDLMFEGPEQIARMVMPKVGDESPSNVVASLQTLFDDMTDYAGQAWSQAGLTNRSLSAPAEPSEYLQIPLPPSIHQPPYSAAPIGGAALAGLAPINAGQVAPLSNAPLSMGAPQFVAMALWASALLLLASSVGLLLIVRIILALLLMLGPAFVALALFGATRSMFEGWLRATVKFALVPLMVLPLSAGLVVVLTRFVVALPPGPILGFRDTPALAILTIVLVFSAVQSQVLSLTGTIAGAIRIPRSKAKPNSNRAEHGAELPVARKTRAEIMASLVPIMATPVSDSSGAHGSDQGFNRVIDGRTIRPTGEREFESRLGQTNRRSSGRAGFVTDLHRTVR